MPTNTKTSDVFEGVPEHAAERLAEIFTDLQRSFMTRLSTQLAKDNVSFAQYFLLTFLDQQQMVTMTEVARWMGHTTAAATGMIDRLEALGLAKRTRPKEDRRKIGVKISPKGQKLVISVRADIVTSVRGLIGHLEPQEAATWLTIYEKIHPLCK
jgi:DNA-binding MarR family transcriptional regulator